MEFPALHPMEARSREAGARVQKTGNRAQKQLIWAVEKNSLGPAQYMQVQKIKGPDNPTSQLLPKMSFNGFSGDREGRKDKGGGERSRR